MNCKQVKNNVLFFIDNELSSEMTNSFELHIAECKHCKQLYNNVKSSVQIINTEKAQDDDFYFYIRLKQRMENKKYHSGIINFLPKRVLQPIAIICLLVFGTFAGINIGNQYSTNNINLTDEETRVSLLNSYSEETYIAEVGNENMESLFTSNQ
ncbi:MAG: zf-HC2 domain-containing protein [Bacteroidales bacterium]